jgi:hypothetical protein
MSSQVPSANVSLQEYATVIAGLGAGFSLDRAVSLAGVRGVDWGAASDHWQSAIDESAATDLTLLVEFDAALLSAKRRYEPTFEPIESDASAWGRFRRHFVTSADPPRFLTSKGIGLAAYARMEADWVNRQAEDDELAKDVTRAFEGPLGPCPEVTLVPPKDAPTTASLQQASSQQPSLQQASLQQASLQQPSLQQASLQQASLQQASLQQPSLQHPSSPPPAQGSSAPRGALPSFMQQAASAPDPRRAEVAISARPKVASPPSSLMSTMLPTVPSSRPVTPFASAATGDEAAARAKAAAPAKSAPPNSPSPLEQTADLPQGLVARLSKAAAAKSSDEPQTMEPQKSPLAGAVLPFAPRAAPPQAAATPDLTLDQYASMCAELAVFKDRQERIFTKYGLADPARRAALDAAWKARLARFPSERSEWERRYLQFEASWRRQKR